jgi:hypothetical protein
MQPNLAYDRRFLPGAKPRGVEVKAYSIAAIAVVLGCRRHLCREQIGQADRRRCRAARRPGHQDQGAADRLRGAGAGTGQVRRQQHCVRRQGDQDGGERCKRRPSHQRDVGTIRRLERHRLGKLPQEIAQRDPHLAERHGPFLGPVRRHPIVSGGRGIYRPDPAGDREHRRIRRQRRPSAAAHRSTEPLHCASAIRLRTPRAGVRAPESCP